MNSQDQKTVVSRIWIDKAYETLDEASILLKENKPVGCVNRLYYAAFYIVSAALAYDGLAYGKHSAVRAALHRDYIKSGKFHKKCGDIYDELFEDRQEGDYAPSTSFSVQDLAGMLERTTFLIHTITSFIKTEISKQPPLRSDTNAHV